MHQIAQVEARLTHLVSFARSCQRVNPALADPLLPGITLRIDISPRMGTLLDSPPTWLAELRPISSKPGDRDVSMLRPRRFRLPRSRRLTTDVLFFHRRVPVCPHDRVIDLSPLRDIRAACPHRISWSLLFLKAFGMVAQSQPVLRQLYFPWPWASVYEHPSTVAMMAIHRDFHDEPWLFWGRFQQPESTSLAKLQSRLEKYLTDPVERVFRQQLQLSALPTPLRRALMWWNLNAFGPARAKRTGTAFLSTIAGQGAEIQCPPAFLTSNLTYGPMDDAGRCRLTIGYDHRLMDGRVVAIALRQIEDVLNGAIATELEQLTAAVRADAA